MEQTEEKRRPSWDVLHAHIVGALRKAISANKLTPRAAGTARELVESPSAVVLRTLARHHGVGEPEMRTMIEAGRPSAEEAIDILLGLFEGVSSYQHPVNDSTALRLDEGKRVKVRVRTRSGAPYWRAGLKWVGEFVEADVTDAQLKELRADGVLVVEDATVPPPPPPKPLNVSESSISPRTLFEPAAPPPQESAVAPSVGPDDAPKPDAKAVAKPDSKTDAKKRQ